MSWLKKLTKREERTPQEAAYVPDNPKTICLDAFKSHWLQVCEVISATSSRPIFVQTSETVVKKVEAITADDVDTVWNLLEQMIYLLNEEQASGELLGPILEYTITQDVFEKLYSWWQSASSFKGQLMLNMLKLYEALISQAQHSLLHHKQLVTPMLKLLSSTVEPKSEELDGHIVVVLNLLCVWMNRDPTLLEIFFNTSTNHGPANFVLFSLLIEYIHREGTVGQQARDALLLCMSLSAENSTVANYIMQHSNFCPVLATGLSALYSTLPRNMEVRADDWHCLQKSDWSYVPELINFMNSFDFCNSVIEVAHESVSEQLLEFFYNGFLVSVFGPSLHKTSASEVVVTTAYLNLFLRSVTAPALMRCFLRFLLTHRHENGLIINTLIQRIASGNRLALVSLSLIRTLVDLNCEDLMLQLVFRYLMPCQHILASQRRSICDVDIYNASASRFLALTPAVCVADSSTDMEDEIFLPVDRPKQENNTEATGRHLKTLPGVSETAPSTNASDGNSPFHTLSPPLPLHEPIRPTFYRSPPNHSLLPANGAGHSISRYTVNEDLSVTVNMHSASNENSEPSSERRSRTITSPSTMAEFGPDLNSQLELNTSYMDYLEDAKVVIDQCREACSGWSAAYDGSALNAINITPHKATPNNDSQHGPTPDETNNQTKENPTSKPARPPDSMHSNTSDTAMKALSATYQALNLTALAFNKNDKSHVLKTPSSENKVEPPLLSHNLNQNPDTEKTQVLSPDIAGGGDSLPTDVGTVLEPSVSVDECFSPSNQHNANSLPNNTDIVNDNINQTSSKDLTSDEDSTSLNRSRSSTTNMSSVDEFFRGLMEIVPKTTREKMEGVKNTKEQKQTEEDIESGIEISSDGDAQATTREQVVDDAEASDSGSHQNEDSMSQLSLNTDEIEETTEESSRNDRKHDLGVSDGKLTNNSRNYSYADDSDDDFDDTSSIASTSFYEATNEYSPTEISVGPDVPLKLQGIPYTGPLIGNLFAKLDQMISNSLYENLLLTGIVTRLAAYPQPLLRSFLLNTHMVFHPSVRSLYQVLNSARNKIDAYAEQISDFKVLVRRAQKYLLARGSYPFSGDARTRNNIQDRPMPVPKIKSKTLGDMFKRRKPKDQSKKKSRLSALETLLESRDRSSSKETVGSEQNDGAVESTSMFYIKQRVQQREKEEQKLKVLRTKNAVYASIVLAEFLKELAAVAQEHAVARI